MYLYSKGFLPILFRKMFTLTNQIQRVVIQLKQGTRNSQSEEMEDILVIQ